MQLLLWLSVDLQSFADMKLSWKLELWLPWTRVDPPPDSLDSEPANPVA